MMDVVLDGLLLKSPPAKRFCKAKWRERWFVLRHSGQIPGQFVLEYYTDSTCRKLKGRIDLDQCEQVDAGLPYENRKTHHQHMFNIHTPKRVYYLVAKSESDMNKWVDCICSVCGLKIRMENDISSTSEPMNPISTAVATQQPLSITPTPTNPNLTSEPSPYIPISECITGKPIISNGHSLPKSTNKPARHSTDDLLSSVVPLPPPKMEIIESTRLATSEEFYDHPRPAVNDESYDHPRLATNDDFYDHPRTSRSDDCQTSPEPNLNDTYKVPPPRFMEDRGNNLSPNDVVPLCPPKVNWQTYPQGMGPMDISYDVPVHSIGLPSSNYDVPPPHNVGPLNSTYDIPFQASGLIQESIKHSISGAGKLQTDTEYEEAENKDDDDPIAPPRPPKPRNLGDRKKDISNWSPTLPPTSISSLYDTPPSSKGVFLSKHLPAKAFEFLKNTEDISSLETDLSPSSRVPPPPCQAGGSDATLDDMYDFPKPRMDTLTKKVPPPQTSTSSLRKSRQHAYTNAPPGLFAGKDTVMNYEYRPGLMNRESSPVTPVPPQLENLSAFDVDFLDMPSSPPPVYSPSMAPQDLHYTNIGMNGSQDDLMTEAPPMIDRGLKPKKKLSDASDPGFFNLAPPPSGHSKRSFRKQRAAPSPTPGDGLSLKSSIPLIPRQFTDQSSSDDDTSSCGGSRRNSNNDDQSHHFFLPPALNKIGKGEIQYLDLDLEPDGAAKSPRSPECASAATGRSQDRSSSSTVYKTVDFVKTKAFNVMRQNVEETYRKNQ